MIALIDADILLYEIGAICEYPKDEPIKSWDYCMAAFDGRVRDIVRGAGADDHLLFISGSDNFRYDVATVKPYKGNRKAAKPFHYTNLKNYAILLGAIVSEGCEADDMMAVYQTEALKDMPWTAGDEGWEPPTIICSRDKDLRQVMGMHYGWESGQQPEFRPQWVNELGDIELVQKHDEEGKLKSSKIVGTGSKFFWSQVLTGDTVDNIPGLPRCGPVKAYDILDDCVDEEACRLSVLDAYLYHYTFPACVDALKEQAQLCWMVRELDDEGKPVMWGV